MTKNEIKAGSKLTVYRVYKTGNLSNEAVASLPKYHTEITVESVTNYGWKGTSVVVSGKFKNIPQLWITEFMGKTILKTGCHQKTKSGNQLFYELVVVEK
tara:strand:+ start:1804 stop:2103 length:300 start_codon:yes stop_codon:yes gene_type:complete